METVRDRELYSERVVVDGKDFIDCQFHDCELVYNGGSVTFSETAIFRCHWSFGGAAHRTINLLECFCLQVPKNAPRSDVRVC